MSLSATSEEKVTGLQSLLSIVQAIKPFFDDHENLNKWVKEAYSLPDAERALADEARARIQEYRDLIIEQKKKKDALDEFHKSLINDQKALENNTATKNAEFEKQQAGIDDSWAKIKDANKEIEARKKELDDRDVAQAIRDRDLIEKQNSIEVAAANLQKSEADLLARKKSVDDYEAHLKSIAAQLVG